MNRLERTAIESMVGEISRGVLPKELVARIADRADGVPLFAEELVQTILESAAEGVRTMAIPSTLRDALTARLDALNADRDIVQIGAVIGREFSAELLSEIAESDLAAMRPILDRLVATGLVRRQGSLGEDFAFKHALVRDVAYDSLLRPRRHELHLRAAESLARGHGVALNAEPEIVAHHFEEAAHHAEALPYWRLAATRAIASSAYREASAHLQRAIASHDRTPHPDAATELDLLTLTGVVYAVLEGGRSERAYASFSRSVSLSAGLAENENTYAALNGQCFCDYMCGRMSLARERSKELLALSERLGLPDLSLEALHASWAIGASTGDPQTALRAIRRGISIYEPSRHHVHVTKFGTGHDSGVCALGFGSQMLVLSGRVAEGYAWIERTKALVAQLGHPFSQCIGLQHAAGAYLYLGDYEPALALANETVAIAETRKFPMPLAHGKVIAGIALIGMGEGRAESELVASILSDPKCQIPINWFPLHNAALALHELRIGEGTAARERLERARDHSAEIGGCHGEPLIHLSLARLARENDVAESLSHLDTATALARASGSRLLELRAAVARVECLEQTGAASRDAARDDLLRLLAAFDGESDCQDVRIARAAISGESTVARREMVLTV